MNRLRISVAIALLMLAHALRWVRAHRLSHRLHQRARVLFWYSQRPPLE